MYIDRRRIVEKLDNHSKLLSMISDKVIPSPLKQTLINDVKEIKQIVEIASRQENKNGNPSKYSSS